MAQLIEGNVRMRKGFVILKCINGEWRWFQYCEWEQVVMSLTAMGVECDQNLKFLTWVNTRWMN